MKGTPGACGDFKFTVNQHHFTALIQLTNAVPLFFSEEEFRGFFGSCICFPRNPLTDTLFTYIFCKLKHLS